MSGICRERAAPGRLGNMDSRRIWQTDEEVEK
jgi:hypothetical protein